ncbi:MAG: hypothetical protein DMF06_05580 [Verrucomicrobia bacterium]|nr:MAG: hypothetical protein DMF06_05580 [Verrucomicrobiota bacterium]
MIPIGPSLKASITPDKMIDFPAADAVEAELANIEPLAVLFGHGCSAAAHSLHGLIAPAFEAAGLDLRRDPFGTGDNVQVAMQRLQIHGLIFHATPKSVASQPCAVELRTAADLAAPIFTLRDQIEVPEQLRDRIFLELSEPGAINENDTLYLASAMRMRARVHWVWQWLRESSRSVMEREGGVNWLLQQSPQILAEFFNPLAGLHQLEDEDPTVSALLAGLLERTGMRSEAKQCLGQWWHAVRHPLSRQTITDIFAVWGAPQPKES